MKLSKKLIFTTAALALAGSMAAEPAAAQTKPTETKNIAAAMFKRTIDDIAEKFIEKYIYITQLHQKAIETNDTALLAHTEPASKIAEERLNKICVPITSRLGPAFEEQVKKYPKLADPLHPYFRDLGIMFENSCSAGLLPNITVSANGEVTSDLKISARDYDIERLKILLESNNRALAAADEVERSSKTSGFAYIDRMYKRAEALYAADQKCKESGKIYEQALISKSVPDIRWKREKFIKVCTQPV